MSATGRNDARINVRLPSELKRIIEEAAAALGQTVSDFAISSAVREARQVLDEAQVTRLSNRDRDRLLKALDEVDAEPNAALKAAAKRYQEWIKASNAIGSQSNAPSKAAAKRHGGRLD